MLQKVSVAICTYNRSDNLFKAVKNIFRQTYKEVELIIVNDCSSDKTKVVLDLLHIKYPSFKLIHNERNLGLAASRNLALKNSTGEWFTFVDDDDLWEPDFIEKMLHSAIESGCSASFSGAIINDEPVNYVRQKTTIKDAMLDGHTPPVGAQLYRLSELKKIGGYENSLKTGVDHDLWISLAAKNNISCIFNDFSLIHPDKNSSSSTVKMTKDISNRVDGIYSSIVHWKISLKVIGGDKFYLYFKQEYRFYLQRRFILLALRQKNPTMLFDIVRHHWLRQNKLYFVVRFSKFLLLRKLKLTSSGVSQFDPFRH
jgi:glycosyltransferase involved in cell wall biosynthesis